MQTLILCLLLLGQSPELLTDLKQVSLYLLDSLYLRLAGALSLIELLLARLNVLIQN